VRYIIIVTPFIFILLQNKTLRKNYARIGLCWSGSPRWTSGSTALTIPRTIPSEVEGFRNWLISAEVEETCKELALNT